MKELEEFKVILWDFDGVLMDSMPVRDKGFELVLKDKKYPANEITQLMIYHRANGGLSRYAKFRYFFENIRNEKATKEIILMLAASFSKIMLENLCDSQLLINDSLDFVKRNYRKYEMHIVSGSDQTELRHICSQLGIADYFKSIHGSPVPKIELVNELLHSNSYLPADCILIGDSVNDYEAATKNKISFAGYNNPNLKSLNAGYIHKLSTLNEEIF